MNLKAILMAVGAFVLGLGGSTAVVVMRTPVKTSPAASSPAQHPAPTPASQAAPDSVAPTGPGHTAPTPPAPPVTSTAAVDPASAASLASRPAPAESTATAVSAALGSAAGYRQVARMLSNMKPADAGKIVAYLNDDQLEGILGQLGVRQAASLMAQLPTERAAAMSRRIIKHTGTEAK